MVGGEELWMLPGCFICGPGLLGLSRTGFSADVLQTCGVV